jgi:predicted DNA-binding transcriptional regulator AlpA
MDCNSTTSHSATPRHEDGLLIRASRLWQLLGISAATGWRWHAAGKLLRPINFGTGAKTTLRWRMDEVRDWIAAGCPNRERWEAMRGATTRR